jgi:hypothetical protein
MRNRGVLHTGLNDPRILKLGEKLAKDAYDLASELHSYGASADRLLTSWEERDPDEPRDVCIPRQFADALMALLLSLPRPSESRGPRRRWSPEAVKESLDRGATLYEASRAEAARTGANAETIERRMRARRKRQAERRAAE